MLWIARHLDAPVEGGARDREVLQAAFDKSHDLVEPLLRQDEVGMPSVEVEQLLLVGGELEKIALLLDPFDRRTLRADTFARVVEPGLVFVVIRFVAHRVPAGILAEVNVARRFHLLPDGDRRTMVALFGGSDEYVVRAVEPLHHGLEARHVAFDQLRRGELLLRRGLQHLHAVLVGAGDEEHVVAVEPHETGDCIGRDRLVGMADMGRAIGIGDGRGEIVAGLVSHRSFRGPWSFRVWR